jgi:hypothetical protein
VHVLAYFVPLDPATPCSRSWPRCATTATCATEAGRTAPGLGFERITLEYLTELSGNVDSIGRPHFAQAMFELHPEIVGERNDESWNRLFTDWLGNGGGPTSPRPT